MFQVIKGNSYVTDCWQLMHGVSSYLFHFTSCQQPNSSDISIRSLEFVFYPRANTWAEQTANIVFPMLFIASFFLSFCAPLRTLTLNEFSWTFINVVSPKETLHKLASLDAALVCQKPWSAQELPSGLSNDNNASALDNESPNDHLSKVIWEVWAEHLLNTDHL